MTIAIGITHCSNDVDTSSKPSTALSTEIAGVMMPSPYNNAVPNTPNETRMPALATVRPRFGITSAVSAKIPPSPLLSARMTNIRYLIEMMMTSDQKANEHTP